MATKAKPPAPSNPDTLSLSSAGDETIAQAAAREVAKPFLASAIVTHAFGKNMMGQVDIMTLRRAMRDESRAMMEGNLSSAEAMLASQAIALNMVFGEMARRADMNRSEYPLAFDRYMKIALKAQAQCRATLETLAAVKNPPVVFARQANIAHGPQQVNNVASNAPAPARGNENQNAPDELLGGAASGA